MKNNKKSFLSDDAKFCSLGKIVKLGENKYEKIHYRNAIGKIIIKDGENYFVDLLDNNHIYDVMLEDDDIQRKIREGEFYINKPFCYSVYDKKYFNFGKVFNMQNEEEIKKYLIDYNIANNVNLYWTFLDEEEIKKLDKIADENMKKYYYMQ